MEINKEKLLLEAITLLATSSTDPVTRRYCFNILLDIGEKERAASVSRQVFSEYEGNKA